MKTFYYRVEQYIQLYGKDATVCVIPTLNAETSNRIMV